MDAICYFPVSIVDREARIGIGSCFRIKRTIYRELEPISSHVLLSEVRSSDSFHSGV